MLRGGSVHFHDNIFNTLNILLFKTSLVTVFFNFFARKLEFNYLFQNEIISRNDYVTLFLCDFSATFSLRDAF